MLSCFVVRQIKYNTYLNYTNLVLVQGRTYLQISIFFIKRWSEAESFTIFENQVYSP